MVSQQAATKSTEYSDNLILVAEAVKGDAATVNTWVAAAMAAALILGIVIAIIFYAMAVGLAVGMGFLSLAALLTMVVGVVILLLEKSGFGSHTTRERELHITIPEDLNYNGIFDDVFQTYTRSHMSEIPVEEIKEKQDFSQIEHREDRIILETAFQVLSKEECQIIVLHAVSGMKHREIGELLHEPLSTVLSKYNRGIKKLRRQLEERL